MKASDISRFWSLVAKGGPNECWNWTAGRSRGYGQTFRIDGVQIGAHRVAAHLAYGPRPKNAFVLHSCDNKLCCNPGHLRYGTQMENVHDALERGQHVPPPIIFGRRNGLIFGEDVWNATLVEYQVREIWRLHLSGKNTAEIAAITKTPRDAAVDVCRGRTWRHLSNAPSVEQLSKGGIRRGKLTKEDIETAKRLIKEGKSNKEIGALLGTSPTPISYLRNYGTTWRPKP